MGSEGVVLLSLIVIYGVIAWRTENWSVVGDLIWRSASARPPMLLVATLVGWSWVISMAERAGLKVEMVLGPSRPLAPMTVLRFAMALLAAILACRLFPYAIGAAYFNGVAPPGTRLASDLAAYFSCLLALGLPPSRFFFLNTSTRQDVESHGYDEDEVYASARSGAHQKYGHGLLAETSHARDSLAQTLWESLLAPFAEVTFWHVIVADYLTSLAKALGDAHVTACVALRSAWLNENHAMNQEFYDDQAYSPHLHSVWWEQRRGPCTASILNASALALPFWCRFFQCIAVYKKTRHPKNLYNALKYATAFPLIYVGHLERNFPEQKMYRHLFILCAILQSSATFFWDILMDWTLFKPLNGGFLCGLFDIFSFRDSLIVSNAYTACLAFVLLFFDLALRFAWTLSVFANFSTRGSGMFLFELIEIIRRTVWALFRIEWEYLHQGCDLVDTRHRRRKLNKTSDHGAVELMKMHADQGPKPSAPLLDDSEHDASPPVGAPHESEEERPSAISV